ncbi:MAG: DUF1640 domain-containing protein [Rhodocyclaceae bacterium]|nr:DUF1640 domain-containing protein [Rhodocyclaceae bacterium]
MAIDTLQMTDRLTQAGMDRQQAEAVVRAVVDAQTERVTREQLEIALAPLRTDLAVLKWMMAATASAVFAQLLKGFFGS